MGLLRISIHLERLSPYLLFILFHTLEKECDQVESAATDEEGVYGPLK